LIEIKDVITMKIPFPDISSTLAVQAHMYICSQNGQTKNFFKCESAKPRHLMKNSRPFKRVKELTDPLRNPFNRDTIIDCDRFFILKNAVIPLSLRANRNVCDELFSDVIITSSHQSLEGREIDISELVQINHRIGQH